MRLSPTALDVLCHMATQVPAERLAVAVRSCAPGSRPEQMDVSSVARCLGVEGMAQCWNVPMVVLLRQLGPERCAIEDLIRPNPYVANGHDAFDVAYTPAARNPACGCTKGMGDIYDIIEGDDPNPKPPTVGPDGWPAAPAFRAGNWKFTGSTGGTYMLAQDDTLSGLARLYLGRPDRWLEIWRLQPFRFQYKPDPSSKNPGRAIREGDEFIMPAEAVARAKQMIAEGKPSAPPTGGAPGTLPGESKDGIHQSAPTTNDEKKKLLTYAAIGAGVLVVGGGIAYAASS